MMTFKKKSNAHKFITFIKKTNADVEKLFDLRFIMID